MLGSRGSQKQLSEVESSLSTPAPAEYNAIQVEELIRKAKVDSFTHVADSLFLKKKDQLAFVFLDSALLIAKTEHGWIADIKGTWLLKRKRYDDALAAFSVAHRLQYKPDSVGYKRALCFAKKKDIPSAVNALQEPMALGNGQADSLYQAINPLKKRVAYYITRCCDGTSSSAKGRGACSHHGGVCDWNEPQYQTYREY